jgi:hypothetical protein
MNRTHWNQEKAQQRARGAYRFVARVLPPGANLEPIGWADRRALEAEAAHDWPAHEEALRDMMREARRQAVRRRGKGAA